MHFIRKPAVFIFLLLLSCFITSAGCDLGTYEKRAKEVYPESDDSVSKEDKKKEESEEEKAAEQK